MVDNGGLGTRTLLGDVWLPSGGMKLEFLWGCKCMGLDHGHRIGLWKVWLGFVIGRDGTRILWCWFWSEMIGTVSGRDENHWNIWCKGCLSHCGGQRDVMRTAGCRRRFAAWIDPFYFLQSLEFFWAFEMLKFSALLAVAGKVKFEIEI